MYAIVKVGSKQYRVEDGAQLTVDRLKVEAGSTFEDFQILLVGDEDSTQVGAPAVEGAKVAATVLRHEQGRKINVFKYKAKKNYRRRIGSRPQQTLLRIDSISI